MLQACSFYTLNHLLFCMCWEIRFSSNAHIPPFSQKRFSDFEKAELWLVNRLAQRGLNMSNACMPQAKRNNKYQTNKNLRCFPLCSELGHIEQGFRDRPVEFHVTRLTPPMLKEGETVEQPNLYA